MPPRQIKVFIASAGDLAAERVAFRDTIDILNAGFGDGAAVEFIPMGWEDTLATTGRRPQAVINADIDSCEVFLLVVYRRWGQEAPDAAPYASYTEEEFHRALERFSRTGSPTIFVFFKHIDPAERAHPDDQLEKTLLFRRQLEESRRVLYRSFADGAAFKREIDAHLRAFVKGENPTPEGSTDRLVLPIEYVKCVEKAKAEAEASLRHAVSEQDRAGAAEAKKALLALRLSERAAQAALDGRLEDARQDFAMAIDGSAYGATLLLAFQFYFRTGDLGAAESVVARILSAPVLEPNFTAAALVSMGAICLDRGQYARAIELYAKSRALCGEVGNLALLSQIGSG